MNKSFFAGIAVGAAVMAGALALKHAKRPLETPAPAATVTTDSADKLASAQKRLAAAEGEARHWKTEHDKLRETAAKPAATATAEPAPADPKKTEEAKKAAEIQKLAMLMNKVQVGKPLPDEIAKELDLDPAQRQALDGLFVAEGPKMWGMVRALGEESKIAMPAEEGLAMVIAALGSSLEKDQAKMQEMFMKEDAWTGTHYLEELLGADSAIVKITDRGRQLRQQTLAQAMGILRDDQKEKFAKLFATNLNFAGASFSFPENYLIRRN